MSTSETMQDLLKMLGGVKWIEKSRRHWLWNKETQGWGICRSEVAPPSASVHEAQALIQQAAIEWLRQGRREIRLYSPSTAGGNWQIFKVHQTKRWLQLIGEGQTLLEALHMAVKAVKESKDAS